MGKKRKKIERKLSPQSSGNSIDTTGVQDTVGPSPSAKKSLWQVTTSKAFALIAIVGLCAFFTGLTNPFLGDDYGQIVNNPVVHSITAFGTFFQGGTFYYGDGGQTNTALSSGYYRPLMSLAFSIVYSVFGPNPLAFHVFQLALHIICAFLIFLIMRYFFKPIISLSLALLFTVHPMNSQAVFYIQATQEPLFLVFGLLAFWSLLRYHGRSWKYLIITVVCLFLAMLSKESGALFIAVSILYVAIFDSKRLKALVTMLAPSLAIYLGLRFHAVGLGQNPHLAPIDELGLPQRLFNIPAIIAFYLTGLLLPTHLAHAYDWAYNSISLKHFIAPLVLDIVAVVVLILLAFSLYKHGAKRALIVFLFFAVWTVIGLALHLQVIPLDFTVSDSWLYFMIIGVLGMLGSLVDAFGYRAPKAWVIGTLVLLICVLGTRTALRGLDYNDRYKLAYRDIVTSPGDYISQADVAYDVLRHGGASVAKQHATLSISSFPSPYGYDTLGLIFFEQGKYGEASTAFSNAAHLEAKRNNYDPNVDRPLNEHLATLLEYVGDPVTNAGIVQKSLNRYPNDGTLWLCLALLQYRFDVSAAKASIQRAQVDGVNNQYFYSHIMHDQPITLLPPTLKKQ